MYDAETKQEEIVRLQDDYKTDFSVSFSLVPDQTALLIIDMQYVNACRTTGLGKILYEQGKQGLVHYRYDRIEKTIIPNIQKALGFFRKGGLRVIYITLGSLLPDYCDVPLIRRAYTRFLNNCQGNIEHEILAEIKPQQGELVINKTTTGAFASSSIDSILRSMGINYLVMCGISTNMCVEATAREAADRGYWCILAADACGANKQSYHDAALLNHQRSYGRVERMDTILKELGELQAKL